MIYINQCRSDIYVRNLNPWTNTVSSSSVNNESLCVTDLFHFRTLPIHEWWHWFLDSRENAMLMLSYHFAAIELESASGPAFENNIFTVANTIV